jgi:CRP-like cAMP-binding protein
MNCLKKNFSLFDNLIEEELIHINSHRTTVSYRAGEFIFKEGTRPFGLLCLSEGKVKISMTGNAGNELILSLKKPVNFLGFEDLISGRSHRTSAQVLEDASVCVISRADFFDVVKKNHNLLQKISLYLVGALNEVQERMASLTQKHMRARIADTLIFIHSVYGNKEADGSLDLPLKRSDIAALSNMTTANAIRTLSELSDEGLIKIEKRAITILSMNQLNALSIQG